MDDLTFTTMMNVLQSGMWLLNDLETYLRPLNMSQARLSVLLSLENSEDGRISPKDLARITGKSRPAITRIMDKLAQDGFITILQNRNDGRGKQLTLTESGKAVLDRIKPEYNERIMKMSSGLSEHDREQLNLLLRKIDFLDREKILYGNNEL